MGSSVLQQLYSHTPSHSNNVPFIASFIMVVFIHSRSVLSAAQPNGASAWSDEFIALCCQLI